jgi:heme exporter protein D
LRERPRWITSTLAALAEALAHSATTTTTILTSTTARRRRRRRIT